MALRHEPVTATDPATMIASGHSNGDKKTILLREASDTIYIGGDASVDDTTGFPLKINETISIELAQGDEVWIFSAGDETARMLVSRSELA